MTQNSPKSSATAQDALNEGVALTQEAIARVSEFVNAALENPNKMTSIIQNNFAELFQKNPQFEIKAISAFYEQYKGKLSIMPMLERLKSIKGVTGMFERIFSQSAKSTLNISLDNALKAAKSGFENKQASLHNTYHGVQDDLYAQVTGRSIHPSA